jgi:uncharacterized membrane protein required for colicin V production
MWYDLLVLAILGFFTLRGAARGLLSQLAGIAAIVICLVFAESISAAFGPYVSLQPPLNHWVVMFAAYLVCSFIAFGFARVIDDWMERAKLESFNTHLGAVFGLLKGIIICMVLTFFLVTLSPAARDALSRSKSGYAAAYIMHHIHPVMPEKLKEALAKYLHISETGAKELQDVLPPGSIAAPGTGTGTPPVFPFPSGTSTQPNAGDPWLTGGTPQSNTQPQPPQPGTQQALDLFMSQLPTTMGNDLRYLVGQSLANTPPDQWAAAQQQLWNMLRQTRPEDLRDLQTRLVSNQRQTLSQAIAGWMGGFVSPGTTAPAPTAPASYLPNGGYSPPATGYPTQPTNPYPQTAPPQSTLPTFPQLTQPQPQPRVPAYPSMTQPQTPVYPQVTQPQSPAPQQPNQPWSQPQWSQPQSPVQNQAAPPLVTAQRSPEDELLYEISRAFSSIPPVQLQMQADIRQRLTGLPPGVGQGVLEDWRRDLWQAQSPDPDPGTDANATLETRIVRQLQSRGIQVNRLSSELQHRLEGATLR